MPMIGVEFEFAAARRTGHSKEGGASGIERFSCAKESIVRPRHGHQKTPSFASIALPMATRLGASVAAGMSMFNAMADPEADGTLRVAVRERCRSNPATRATFATS
jgi:hypothetical protein